MSDEKKNISGSKIYSLPKSEKEEAISFISGFREVQSSKMTYYVWLSRFFILLATISLMLFVSGSLVIFHLAPKVQVEPFLVINQDASREIVRNEAISPNMPSKNQLMEVFIKQYVLLRNTIISDEREMQTRWYPGGMVNMYSSDIIFADFTVYRENVWQLIRNIGMSREVEIISASKVGGENSNVWKVDFKTYDLTNDRRDPRSKAIIVTTRYWTASITAYFIPERFFMGLRLLNPLGFTVLRYSQTEVEIL
ncbi:MAG: type IV secretion system protein [Alphaproteobacteria bacterium]|nr:type IV secretion system protein [Alphaproteobacteria bacterium]